MKFIPFSESSNIFFHEFFDPNKILTINRVCSFSSKPSSYSDGALIKVIRWNEFCSMGVCSTIHIEYFCKSFSSNTHFTYCFYLTNFSSTQYNSSVFFSSLLNFILQLVCKSLRYFSPHS